MYDKIKGQLLQSLPKIHKRHGVGCIEFLINHHKSSSNLFITTGRDGSTCEFVIEEENIKFLKKQHLKINWLEEFHTLNNGTKCILGTVVIALKISNFFGQFLANMGALTKLFLYSTHQFKSPILGYYTGWAR